MIGFMGKNCMIMWLVIFNICFNLGWAVLFHLHRIHYFLPRSLILRSFRILFRIFRSDWNSVKTMHPLKAPGPDGFHAHFYQHNWDIMGSNISRFIQTIFITSRIPEDLTRVKLVLIPKTPNPETVSHLCPISLCNTLYKLLTKLLVNRLKPFLPYMIHLAQSSFVPGRRATNSYIITQEILRCIHKQRGRLI